MFFKRSNLRMIDTKNKNKKFIIKNVNLKIVYPWGGGPPLGLRAKKG